MEARASDEYASWPVLSAVVETPRADWCSEMPWVVPPERDRLVRLYGDLGEEDLALVVVAIAGFSCNRDLGMPSLATLTQAELIGGLGGVAFVSGGGYRIGPGCCQGLEDWAQWRGLCSGIEAGKSERELSWPWWGHDGPGFQLGRGSIWLIDSEQQLTPPGATEAHTLAFELSKEQFNAAVQRMERDMATFRTRLEAWCASMDPEHGPAAAARIAMGLELP